MSILREKEVLEITKLSRMTIWRMERAGTFPRRFKIGCGHEVQSHGLKLRSISGSKSVQLSARGLPNDAP
jgi:hypothetical protein